MSIPDGQTQYKKDLLTRAQLAIAALNLLAFIALTVALVDISNNQRKQGEYMVYATLVDIALSEDERRSEAGWELLEGLMKDDLMPYAGWGPLIRRLSEKLKAPEEYSRRAREQSLKKKSPQTQD